MRNGLIDGTKCQSSEQKGNLFQLLCIAHTTSGSAVLKRCLKLSEQKWKQYIEFLKLYLCMEEWFHDANNKNEVIYTQEEIAKVLQSLQHFPPRKINSNGYNIPKMHGMTKMQEYMRLFGSGINFYGGPGESAHKHFIKIPGPRTQRRVSEFAQQTALQYHDMLVSRYAAEEGLFKINNCKQHGEVLNTLESMSTPGDISIILSGKYDFVVTAELLQMMEAKRKVNVDWSFDEKKSKQRSDKHRLSQDFVKVLHQRLQSSIGIVVTGFTKAVISCGGEHTV